jgi:hypothetical protein
MLKLVIQGLLLKGDKEDIASAYTVLVCFICLLGLFGYMTYLFIK